MQETYIIGWCALMAVMLIAEAVTFNLVTIWFAAGALAAVICASVGASVPVQAAVFFLVSGILLALLLPYVRRHMGKKHVATNADRIIGAEGIVTKTIDTVYGSGQIKVCGATWSAASKDGTAIREGTAVRVDSIAGVRAIVTPRS